MTKATVEEILLDQAEGEWVATGVRFRSNDRQHSVSVSGEVILSAGSIQSPQLLELSGIGNPDILRRAGIATKVKSPRVGENLQDHLSELQ